MSDDARTDDELYDEGDHPVEDYSTWTKHTVANAREVDRLRAELDRHRVAGDAVADLRQEAFREIQAGYQVALNAGASVDSLQPLRSALGALNKIRLALRSVRGDAPACDGSADCPASAHVHGCFAERPAAAPTDGQAPADERRRCPMDGEPLIAMSEHRNGVTFYRHADGHGHLDALAELRIAAPADDTAAPDGSGWRVGRKVGRTVYDATDQLIGVMDTPALALRVVEAANGCLTEDSAKVRADRDELLATRERDQRRHDDLVVELRRMIAVRDRQLAGQPVRGSQPEATDA